MQLNFTMSLSLDWTDLKRGGIVGSLLLGDPVGVAVAECDVPWRPEYPPTLKMYQERGRN